MSVLSVIRHDSGSLGFFGYMLRGEEYRSMVVFNSHEVTVRQSWVEDKTQALEKKSLIPSLCAR